MVDFKRIAEVIRGKVLRRGYSVDPAVLAEKLEEDAKRIQLYNSVFSTNDGRLVLTDLMTEGGLLSSHDVDNPLTLARLEGKRAMAIRIASSRPPEGLP